MAADPGTPNGNGTPPPPTRGRPRPREIAIFAIAIAAAFLAIVGVLLISLVGLDGSPPPTPKPVPSPGSPIVIELAKPTGSPDPATTPSKPGGPLPSPPPAAAAPTPEQPATPLPAPSPLATDVPTPAIGPIPITLASPPAVPTATYPVASPTASPPPSPAAVEEAPITAQDMADSQEDPRIAQALASLRTDEDRIGQLFLLGWAGGTAEQARPMLRELRPGGVVFINNTSSRAQAAAINAGLGQIAAGYGLVPPLIAVDHEGGLVQRIGDVVNLGANWDFGRARPSERAACERGLSHARQLRGMGFSMNLAPVLDVNNNPRNPVIGSRSYGADPRLVATLGSAYTRGLQGGGVVAVGKHFPGHGNTVVDSHLALPILPQTVAQLEAIELVPFRSAIAPPTSLAAIMSAHISFPALDPSGVPATLSRPIMTGLLREALGFEGLVLTDDMGAMRAITDRYAPGDAAVRAIGAGVDMLIIGGDLTRQRASRNAVLAALTSGQLSRERVEQAVRRVLRTKAEFGLLDGSTPAPVACA